MMSETSTVGEICTRSTVFAYKSMSVSEAARLMLEQHVGSLVVVEETGHGRAIVGMLTDRDIVVAVVARDFNAQTIRVADIMSSNPIVCREGDPMTDALSQMRHHGVRRIPVTDAHNNLLGIVTLDDMLDIVAEQLQTIVRVVETERKQEELRRG
ncbi:MAG TPA: CBS domain-containing protein [Telluria sp.]